MLSIKTKVGSNPSFGVESFRVTSLQPGGAQTYDGSGFPLQSGQVTQTAMTVTPEPSSLVLLGTGMLGLFGVAQALRVRLPHYGKLWLRPGLPICPANKTTALLYRCAVYLHTHRSPPASSSSQLACLERKGAHKNKIVGSLTGGASQSPVYRRPRDGEKLREVADGVLPGGVHPAEFLLLFL